MELQGLNNQHGISKGKKGGKEVHWKLGRKYFAKKSQQKKWRR